MWKCVFIFCLEVFSESIDEGVVNVLLSMNNHTNIWIYESRFALIL